MVALPSQKSNSGTALPEPRPTGNVTTQTAAPCYFGLLLMINLAQSCVVCETLMASVDIYIYIYIREPKRSLRREISIHRSIDQTMEQ